VLEVFPIHQPHQRSRYELKYLIDEACARRVRDFVRSYLRRDRHAIPEMRFSYPIYSVYFDDPGLALYRATVQAQKNRFKLRVRYYDHDSHSPVFCEIKRRVNDVILKQRAVLRRDALGRLVSGGCPRLDDLYDAADVESYALLREFCRLRDLLHASPNIIVYFEREAWVAPDDENIRVTFDREAAVAHHTPTLRPSEWNDAKVNEVILELKFDDRFPIWMRELVQCCDLHRTRMGKYVHCLDQLPSAARQALSARPYLHMSA
jgi:SPX domain protein involved in polyphosphate accumulation